MITCAVVIQLVGDQRKRQIAERGHGKKREGDTDKRADIGEY